MPANESERFVYQSCRKVYRYGDTHSAFSAATAPGVAVPEYHPLCFCAPSCAQNYAAKTGRAS